LDKNSFTDGTGGTVRNILPKRKTTAKIKTKDDLTYGQKLIVQAFFPNRDYVTVDLWNDEDNAYETTQFYVPDVTYTVKFIDSKGNFCYDPIEFEFISYGR
jgi:hypothetical protein